MRTAKMYQVEGVYHVDLIEDDILIETRKLEGYNIYYATSLVDNWTRGIIKSSETDAD